MTRDTEIERLAHRADALANEVQAIADPAARTVAVAAIQALLDLQGAVLERAMEVVGAEAADRMAGDPGVAGLLLVHGLHPVPMAGRIARALDAVRPYLASHGGGVEVLAVGDDGVVRLRLEGSCHGCPSSTATLRSAIERAIEDAAPDVVRLDVEGVVEPPAPAGFVPLAAIDRPRARAAWRPVDGIAAALAARGEAGIVARDVDGTPVVFCSAGEDTYAYTGACPACGAGLAGAAVGAGAIACAGCGARFDVRRAGRSLDGGARHLEPVPLLVADGEVRVALPGPAGEAAPG